MNRKIKHLLFALLVCGLVTGDMALAQPVITVQPQSQTNVVGSMVTLFVEATGTPSLFYQWRRGGVNLVG